MAGPCWVYLIVPFACHEPHRLCTLGELGLPDTHLEARQRLLTSRNGVSRCVPVMSDVDDGTQEETLPDMTAGEDPATVFTCSSCRLVNFPFRPLQDRKPLQQTRLAGYRPVHLQRAASKQFFFLLILSLGSEIDVAGSPIFSIWTGYTRRFPWGARRHTFSFQCRINLLCCMVWLHAQHNCHGA